MENCMHLNDVCKQNTNFTNLHRLFCSYYFAFPEEIERKMRSALLCMTVKSISEGRQGVTSSNNTSSKLNGFGGMQRGQV
jgi:hypothetical protein